MGNLLERLKIICTEITFTLIIFSSCTGKHDSQKSIEWNQLLAHPSQNSSDSLFIASVNFLKDNIYKQLSNKNVFYNFESGNVKEISNDILTNDSALRKIMRKYNLRYKVEMCPDSQIVDYRFIENTINKSITAYLSNIQNTKNINAEIFLNYILPYKALNEYPENWREMVHRKYDVLVKSININEDLVNKEIKILDHINNDIMTWFRYDENYSPKSFSEILASKKGDCLSMSSLMIFIGRTYGIPIAIDFCPVWANVNSSNHFWDALLLSDSTSIPFLGAEGNPLEYNPFLLFKTLSSGKNFSTFKKPAKVFRYTYSTQERNIKNFISEYEDIPSTLIDEKYIDVTNQYTETKNVEIKAPKNLTKNAVAFLCVYNNNKWTPTDWQLIDTTKTQFRFKNMATDIVYLPAEYSNGLIIPIGKPFLLKDTTYIFTPNTKIKLNININTTNSVEQVQMDFYANVNKMSWQDFELMQNSIAVNKVFVKPQNRKKYTLFYWDNQWRRLTTRTCNNGSLKFYRIPSDGLYKLESDEQFGKGRIFSFQNSKQLWW